MDIIEKLFKNYLEKENEVQLTLKRLGLNQDGHTPLDLQSLSKGTQWKYLTRDDDRIRNRFFIEISSQEHEYSQLYDILRNHLNENVAANVQIDDIFSVDTLLSRIIRKQPKTHLLLYNLKNTLSCQICQILISRRIDLFQFVNLCIYFEVLIVSK